jgi:hypothetical protein
VAVLRLLAPEINTRLGAEAAPSMAAVPDASRLRALTAAR